MNRDIYAGNIGEVEKEIILVPLEAPAAEPAPAEKPVPQEVPA